MKVNGFEGLSLVLKGLSNWIEVAFTCAFVFAFTATFAFTSTSTFTFAFMLTFAFMFWDHFRIVLGSFTHRVGIIFASF